METIVKSEVDGWEVRNSSCFMARDESGERRNKEPSSVSVEGVEGSEMRCVGVREAISSSEGVEENNICSCGEGLGEGAISGL